MAKLEKDSYYSLREAIKHTPLKSRETLSRYIKRYQGADWFTDKIWVKRDKKPSGKFFTRYVISGEWIKEFNKRYKANKLNEHSIFTVDSVRYTLNDIVKYCEKNNIKSVNQFIKLKKDEESNELPSIGND